MYQLPDKPKEENLDFLISYYERLRELYNYEFGWSSMNARVIAESFIYKFKDIIPGNQKDSIYGLYACDHRSGGRVCQSCFCYWYLLGKLWACHDYLEGEDQ